jgi:xanthine dehydrogenase molybdopterin-binding subunit B
MRFFNPSLEKIVANIAQALGKEGRQVLRHRIKFDTRKAPNAFHNALTAPLIQRIPAAARSVEYKKRNKR